MCSYFKSNLDSCCTLTHKQKTQSGHSSFCVFAHEHHVISWLWVYVGHVNQLTTINRQLVGNIAYILINFAPRV